MQYRIKYDVPALSFCFGFLLHAILTIITGGLWLPVLLHRTFKTIAEGVKIEAKE